MIIVSVFIVAVMLFFSFAAYYRGLDKFRRDATSVLLSTAGYLARMLVCYCATRV